MDSWNPLQGHDFIWPSISSELCMPSSFGIGTGAAATNTSQVSCNGRHTSLVRLQRGAVIWRSLHASSPHKPCRARVQSIAWRKIIRSGCHWYMQPGRTYICRLPEQVSCCCAAEVAWFPVCKLSLARGIQWSNDWLLELPFEPGSRGAKRLPQPGCADTGKLSVSAEPGSHGARWVH